MSAQELVSIIVPCRDTGSTLRESIDAALAQTYGNVEIVVVDDGSTDPDTIALLDDISTVARVVRQPHSGASAARNRAIREAKGKYVLPLDSDDLIEPDYVARAVDVMEQRADVGIVYCHADRFGAVEGPWALPDWHLDSMLIDNIIFVTSLFRREDWEAVGGFDEDLRRGAEDWDFWLRIIGLGREVVQFDEVLFHYRVQNVDKGTFVADELAGVYAQVFRNNRDLYMRHLDVVFAHRFSLENQVRTPPRSLRERVGLWRRRIALARRSRV